MSQLKNLFGYFIDLDERGEFYADVRKPDGETVYEIRVGSDCDDVGNIFEDGFMRHKADIEGLGEYLVSLGILGPEDELLDMEAFEARVAELEELEDTVPAL